MTKWKCTVCDGMECTIEFPDAVPLTACPVNRKFNAQWKRVIATPVKEYPPFSRVDPDMYKDFEEWEEQRKGWEEHLNHLDADKRMIHIHEKNLLEMAGNMKALKEQVDKVEGWGREDHERINDLECREQDNNLKERVEVLEKQVFDHRAIVAGILERSDDRVQRLEHQMRNHYHSGQINYPPISEDGSGTERLVK